MMLFLFLVLCFSCKRENQIKGYTRDSKGFYFKLLSIGDGNESPSNDNVVVLEAVMRTQTDSLFWDTRHDASNGLFVSLNSKYISGSCRTHFLKMVEGDSISFLMKPSVLFRDYFDTIVPEFCKNDSLIKMDVKINQIISRAEYAALIKNAQGIDVDEDTELEELQLIDCFLVQHYKSVKADAYGIYILEKKTTGGEEVSAGKKIRIEYQGSFLDGRLLEGSEQTLEFIYGTPDQIIKGLNIVIGRLKKGETTKIILPSRLAFGESGSSNGSIPPYTPLVYTLKIIDIK